MELETGRAQRRSRRLAWVVLMLPAGAALCCGLAVFLVNGYVASAPAAGLPAYTCAGFTSTPPVRIGVSWHSLVSSYLSPLAVSPFAVCLQVPHAWVAPSPQMHSWEWLWP